MSQRRSVRILCAETGRQAGNLTTEAPPKKRTKQVARKKKFSQNTSNSTVEAGGSDTEVSKSKNNIHNSTSVSSVRKEKAVKGGKGAARVNAEHQISVVWRPKVQALKDTNIKLMKKVKKLAEVKAENTSLKK